ncbi:MAG: chorismate synthase [Clostridia bacterium]
MSFTWGKNVKLTIYGESHGNGVGIIIEGIKAGRSLDYDLINRELERRRPGKKSGTTKRNEDDEFKIVSGIFNDFTNGGPLNAYFPNKDVRVKDYKQFKKKPRPSHADYPAMTKYKGFNDYRGGGFFSGRMTAPLVFAGALSKSILKEEGINIYSHISNLGEVIEDEHFYNLNNTDNRLKLLIQNERFMINVDKNLEADDVLNELAKEGNSIGAKVECMAVDVPVGLGEPFFNSIESDLSSLIFSIPGIKAIEFGLGASFGQFKGSDVNDEYYYDKNTIKTFSNHNGGILGGLSTGMPILFTTTFKPTPSISKIQRTVDINGLSNSEISIQGRHDSCIAIRGRVVVESVLAIVLLNFLLGK